VTKRKILEIHNYYQQSGGEDVVFAAEKKLLESRGHEVFSYIDKNTRIKTQNRISAATNTIWSGTSYRRIRKMIQISRPDIAHIHNTFLAISPAAYYACRDEGVPVIQTLHNFRLLCPAATFFRDGHVCVECLGAPLAWPSVVHGCYHSSRLQSATVAAMLAAHSAIGTWNNLVDVYLALTEFMRQKMIEGGLPASRIVVKPNFVSDPGAGDGKGGFGLFVGRLAPEKGIETLLAAGGNMPIKIKIAGGGPLVDTVRKFAAEHPSTVEYLGELDHENVIGLMQSAAFLVFPSLWFEGFPMVIAEAFACGLPVIASNLGAMTELIADQETGFLFTPGRHEDLSAKVHWAIDNPAKLSQIRMQARREYENKYSEQAGYTNLINVYNGVMKS
jgi:glycosyltransferase involved in cell wall biosynthesis